MEQSPGLRETLISRSPDVTGARHRRKTEWARVGCALLVQVALFFLAVYVDRFGSVGRVELGGFFALAQFWVYAFLHFKFPAAAPPFAKAALIFWAVPIAALGILLLTYICMSIGVGIGAGGHYSFPS